MLIVQINWLNWALPGALPLTLDDKLNKKIVKNKSNWKIIIAKLLSE